MDRQMIWAFVDYENIGSLEGITFDIYERIFIFCGPKNTRIKIGDSTFAEFLSIEIIKLKTTGSNNLDFHIAYYLGKFSETADKETEFHIITKDNGFNGLVNHIKKTGRKCKRIALNVSAKPKTNTLSACAKLSIERLKQIDGRKRPRKKDKLANWIGSQCRTISNDIDPNAILSELVKVGLIESTSTGIKYQLKR